MKLTQSLLLLLALAVSPAFCQTQTRVDSVPQAPIELRKPNGQVHGYGLGATTDAARGTALAAAIAAATSGDQVNCLANCTITSSIAKNGVNLFVPGGVTITLSSASTASIFDDASGAMTFAVHGRGRFVRAANGMGHAVFIQNASSVVTISASYLSALYPSGSIGAAEAVYQIGGTLYCDADQYVGADGSAIYWDGGDGYFTGQKAMSGSGEPTVYSHSDATPTGQLWVLIPHIVGVQPVEISGASNGTARTWIISELIEQTAPDGPALFITGQFAYVTAQKLQAHSGTNSIEGALIGISDGAHAYISLDKFSSTDTIEDIPGIGVSGASTVAYIDIKEFDDSGGLPNQGAVRVSGGTCFYSGLVMNLANPSDAFTTAGGTLNVSGVTITTQSANKDLTNSSGTLNVSASVAYNAEKTTGAITRLNPFGGASQVVNDTDGATLAAADVQGQVYSNTGAGAQTFNLPAVTAGMRVTFVLSAAQDVNVNPDNADQILVLTNAVGDAISSDAAAGSRIELLGINSTNWIAIESAGTWSDVN